MKYVREFTHNGELIAIHVKREFQNRQTREHAVFLSDDEQSLQLGVGHYPKNLVGPRHTHEKLPLTAHYEEILHLVRGRMRVDLYGNDRVKFGSFVLRSGDTVHFVSGGHGFKMLTPCKAVEVKQGPYSGKSNKFTF